MQKEIDAVCGLSPFFAETWQAGGGGFQADAAQSYGQALAPAALAQRFDAFLAAQAGDLAEQLRLLRRREMLRIIFRDLSRRADLAETTASLTALADHCIGRALAHCHQEAEEKFAPVRGPDGKPLLMTVLGMGKLGGEELNLSSDVDLIFLYGNQQEARAASGKPFTHAEFYLRVARRFIALLDDVTPVGRVFRVDMRLRPYGDSGPLVSHRAAMEQYYTHQGRDWERYAFIKARVVAGDARLGEDFLHWMKPFVYRRNLDYSALGALREMKTLMSRQLEVKDIADDLKLGTGGIREIEFIAQAHQMIWGGRQVELQERRLLPALARLGELGYLREEEVEGLTAAYIFLRNSEHALQAEQDRQTQQLPASPESQARLAEALGFPDYPAYRTALDGHRQRVAATFTGILTASSAAGEDQARLAPYRALWASPSAAALQAQGLPGEMAPLLTELKASIAQAQLPEVSDARIESLMPITLQKLTEAQDPLLAASRILPIIRATLGRSTYMVLLLENLDALARAIHLCQLSPWVAEQLREYPLLLAELTDRSVSGAATTKDELEAELRAQLRALEQGDLEAQMDTLRQFKLAAMMKVAAQELLAKIPITIASDVLTETAEVILQAALEFAWQHLEARHGLPSDPAGHPLAERFAILAYGKAGGYELAYGSDLDLVFLCPDKTDGTTDGKAPINNYMFYHRVGQRLIHLLTSFTPFGTLYSVDLRLRPQGKKGPLVATCGAFARYHAEESWTWEKQALVRARFCAGDPALGEAFRKIRVACLQAAAKPGLREEVVQMRAKMREHLAPAKRGKAPPSQEEESLDLLGKFDLKHDTGAIVDIEFMVQYEVLAHAGAHENLTRWTDVIRLLDELGAVGIFSEEEMRLLHLAYLAFRNAVHENWLGVETNFTRLHQLRQDVYRIWSQKLGTEQLQQRDAQ